MPQMSLYIDEPTLKKVRQVARRSHTSVSRWVRSRIQSAIEPSWPEGFFQLCGSIADETFARPKQLSSTDESPRTRL
jgi:hypothetical protein